MFVAIELRHGARVNNRMQKSIFQIDTESTTPPAGMVWLLPKTCLFDFS
ncbi:hypothetical protein CTATCC11996_09337 [Comamonas testosteroni ATCC 11996]|nr:hypothetical protein CTATCC11996_09337 [Comamonas testosteroni ATCC 11996]